MRHVAPGMGRSPQRRQGVGRLRPQGRAGARPRPAGARGHRARGFPSRSRRAPRRRPGRRSRPRPSTARSPASAPTGRTSARAAHDLNYLGWAGMLEDTAPGLPPLQPADLAAGALGAVVEVLAAVLERERTGRGARLTISMTHGSHRLVSHRLGGDPLPRFLTGGLACYRIYATADGRWLTVGALEPKFFAPALRGDRPPRARGAPPRPRGAGGARRGAGSDVRDPLARRTGCSSSTARTSASGRWRRSPRPRRRSAREPACRPLLSGSIRAHGGQNSASPDRSGARAAAAACGPGLGRRRVGRPRAAEARGLLARRRPVRRRARDHDGRNRHRAGLVAGPAPDRVRPPGPRQALRPASTSSAATAAACSA